MKLLLFIVLITTSFSASLEDILINSSLSVEEKRDEYSNMRFHSIKLLEYVDVEKRPSGNSTDLLGLEREKKDIGYRLRKEEKDRLINNAKSSQYNEFKIVPYFNKYNSSIQNVIAEQQQIKSNKVVVSFYIDDKRNISDIKILKKSSFQEIDNMITNSITDAKYDFIKDTKKKEKITLHLNLKYL